MEIDESILEQVQLMNAFIITDLAGNILRMNGAATALMRTASIANLQYIKDIDPLFSRDEPIIISSKRDLIIGDESRIAYVYALKMSGYGMAYIYMIDTINILKHVDFDLFLDFIDDAIAVANKDGVLEHANKAFTRLTSINNWKFRDMHEVVERKELEKSLSLEVIKNKKAMQMTIHYMTGETLFWTGIPLINDNGEVEKVISTGRDITKLVELKTHLDESETLKHKYYNRMKTLEALIGADKIIHSSDAMKNVMHLAIKAARSDSPVFIWGESGVGKEVIGNLIHTSSKRKDQTYLGLNCSAIPSELLESELFGYEHGAFTGAKKGGQKGIFEQTNGGTILLDEVTELPLKMQSKLLRVLQENEFIRVGGTKVIPFNSRIIAASNLSKSQLADESVFRRDLFYRLNVIPIYVPPLRERKDDILPLIVYFIKYFNLKYESNIRFSKKLMICLHNYSWPGNVRELKNIVERLIVTADSDEVSIDDYALFNHSDMENQSENDITVKRVMPLKSALQKVEDILIKMAYHECRTITGTADVLKINPSTIHRKLKSGAIQLKPQKYYSEW